MLRDSNGVVCLHSRRAFGSVGSKDEAFFLAFLWSLESMISYRIFKVYFAFEGRVLVNAINKQSERDYDAACDFFGLESYV